MGNSVSHGRLLNIRGDYTDFTELLSHFSEASNARAVNSIVVTYKNIHGINYNMIVPRPVVCFYCNCNMEKIKLIHNPKAGNSAYSRKELISLVESAGFEAAYVNTKNDKSWKDIDPGTRIVVIAGGDGTVRKFAASILGKKQAGNEPAIGLLQLGTANNIANSLKLKGEPGELIEEFQKRETTRFDVGLINNNEEDFFLESAGFGIFPELMQLLKKKGIKDIEASQNFLKELTSSFKAEYYEIQVDNEKRNGNYLLVEVMNTPLIGPRLHLNSVSNPGDGKFEVVLVNESERDNLRDFFSATANKTANALRDYAIQGSEITIKTESRYFHTDDQLLQMKKSKELIIKLKRAALNFLVIKTPSGTHNI